MVRGFSVHGPSPIEKPARIMLMVSLVILHLNLTPLFHIHTHKEFDPHCACDITEELARKRKEVIVAIIIIIG